MHLPVDDAILIQAWPNCDASNDTQGSSGYGAFRHILFSFALSWKQSTISFPGVIVQPPNVKSKLSEPSVVNLHPLTSRICREFGSPPNIIWRLLNVTPHDFTTFLSFKSKLKLYSVPSTPKSLGLLVLLYVIKYLIILLYLIVSNGQEWFYCSVLIVIITFPSLSIK